MRGFAKWAERYAAVFGLSADADTQTLQALERVFELAGFSPEELENATDRLAVNSPGLRRSEHRVAIRDCVLRNRSAQSEQLNRQYETSGRVCEICQNAGCVIVPHLRSVLDGRWDGSQSFGIRYTAAVCCSCGLGQRRYERTGLRTKDDRQLPKQLRLEDYERANSGWREQLAARAAEEVASVHADRIAEPKAVGYKKPAN